MWPVVAGTAATVALAAGIAAHPLSVLVFALSCLGMFGISLYVHEYAHLWALGKYRQTAVIRQQGRRMTLYHHPLPRRQEIRCALLGPLAGVGLCLACGAWCIGTGLVLLGMVAGVAASLHLASLLPGYSDGAILWKYVKKESHD